MGCDIHAHAEIKRDGRWEHVGHIFELGEYEQKWRGKTHDDRPFKSRNYTVFARLAGVRGGEPRQIAAPRGVPADVTDETRDDLYDWRHDGHSHSWLTLEELQSADLDNDLFNAHVKALSEHAGADEARVVFWFDN